MLLINQPSYMVYSTVSVLLALSCGSIGADHTALYWGAFDNRSAMR